MKRIQILLIISMVTLGLSGCDFIIPKDDLNGNNEKVNPINKIKVKEEKAKKTELSKEESEVKQLEQAIAQADYEKQAKGKAAKKEVAPESAENVSEVKENTDIEKEILTYANKYTKATIKTNLGDIKVTLYGAETPLAVGNFIKLSESGFYEKIKFHRVISGFMIQGGDPNSKDENWDDDGKGGPGYSFRDEVSQHKLVKGSLAMANAGKDTNGSQFFIVTAQPTPHLDGKHTNFGEVIEGMDIVEKIEKVRINENDHPTQDVIIEKIELE